MNAKANPVKRTLLVSRMTNLRL